MQNPDDQGTMVVGTLILLTAWLALTRTLAAPFVAVGLISSLVVAWMWRILAPTGLPSTRVLAHHPVRLLLFLLALAKRFVLSTLTTAWLILTGKEEGRMMALPLRITDPLARFLLLNAITLTPSTISLLIEGDLLYIHWLQTAGGRADWKRIKESLEARLIRLFEEVPLADR